LKSIESFPTRSGKSATLLLKVVIASRLIMVAA